MSTDPDRIRQLVEASIGHPDSVSHGEHNYWCPFCDRNGRAKVSHLHVNYHRNVALCHGCGTGFRDLVNLVRALYGEVPASLARPRAVDDLVDFCRGVVDGARAAQAAAADRAPVTLPPEYAPLPREPRDDIGRMVLAYLRSRDLTPRMVEEHAIGYAREGRFRGYSIFPVYVGGALATYTSRATPGLVVNGPKAMHASRVGSRAAVLGFDPAAAMGARRVFVAEGPFSAWAFQRRADPLDAGVAILGKVLHDEQCRLLDRLPACEELVVCLDETEHDATRAAAGKMARLTSKRVSYILLPPGGDPHDQREALPDYVARRRRYNAAVTDVERGLGGW